MGEKWKERGIADGHGSEGRMTKKKRVGKLEEGREKRFLPLAHRREVRERGKEEPHEVDATDVREKRKVEGKFLS